MRRSWVIAWASVVALIAAALCCRVTFRVPPAALLDARGIPQPATMPYSDASASTTRPMEFEFHLRRGVLTPTFFVVVPDDHLLSISLDGRDLSLAGVDPRKLDDYAEGFSYPLGRDLSDGDNVAVVRVLNRGGGPGGLDLRPDAARGLPAVELAVAACAVIVLLGASMRIARCRWASTSLAVFALLLRLAYLWVTPLTVREHDAVHHLEYVHYLLDHHSLPRAADGWAFYHPPLYYVVSAVTYAAFGAMGFAGHAIGVVLQIQSMAIELGFAAFAAATARLWIERIPDGQLGPRLLSREGLATLCAALILFWPTSVMHSVRVGNDDLAYLWFGAALYFGSRWWLRGREGKDRDFHLAAVFGALGVVTKSNCLIIFVVLGVMLLVRLLRDRERRLRRILGYAAPLTLLFVLSASLALHEALVAAVAGKHDHLFVGNADRCNQALALSNRPIYFLWFDFRAFLMSPFTSPWDDAKGRQYFWNYLLKTSLFGEWEIARPWAEGLATALSWVCLAMCPLLASGALMRKRSELLDELPLSALAVLSVAGLALQRVNMPVFHGDFRYVFPLIMPLSYWYVRALAADGRAGWKWVARAGVTLGWVSVGLSVAFICAIVSDR